LAPAAYEAHPEVKRFLAVRLLVSDTVPSDPLDPAYLLTGALAKFRRVKGRGLPRRYRLFFVFSDQARVIIFLFLNDDTTLRQQGARSDPYAVFSRLVERREVGADFAAAYEAWKVERAGGGADR
jgi:toxin YhaV